MVNLTLGAVIRIEAGEKFDDNVGGYDDGNVGWRFGQVQAMHKNLYYLVLSTCTSLTHI